MKKIFTLAMMMTIAISANAMSYGEAKRDALFLSDKMAYELNLSDAQYDAVYEINLDYLMSINGRDDIFGRRWDMRNASLRHILSARQYDRFMHINYFYRPLAWDAGRWSFSIYSHYTDRGHFYKPHPRTYAHYKGGNHHNPTPHHADRHHAHHGNGGGTTWRVTGPRR